MRDWIHVEDHNRAAHLVLHRRRASARSTTSARTTRSPTASSPTSCSSLRPRRELHRAGRRPPRSRPPLLGQHRQGHRAGLEHASTRSTRAWPDTVRLVPRQPLVVGAAEGQGGSLMRVLVTGAGGQLGIDVVATCGAAGDDVFAFDRGGPRHQRSRSRCSAPSRRCAPTSVVNCAAWTAVDACEGDPDRALAAERHGRALAGRGVRIAPVRTSCRSAPTTSSTARSTARTTSGTTPTRRASTASRSWSASARRWRSGPAPPWCARRGCAARNGSNMVKTIMRLAAAAPRAGVRRRPGRPPHVHPGPGAGAAHGSRSTGCAAWCTPPTRVRARGSSSPGEVVAAMGKDPAMVQPDRHRRPAATPPGAAPGQQRARQRRARGSAGYTAAARHRDAARTRPSAVLLGA